MRVILDAEDMHQASVKPTGNGAHVLLPVSWIGKTVKVFLIDADKEDNENG